MRRGRPRLAQPEPRAGDAVSPDEDHMGLSTCRQGILAVLPFLVNRALSMIVLRSMRSRGMDMCVAYYQEGALGYTTDPAEDLHAEGRLLTISPSDFAGAIEQLRQQ